MSEKGQQTESDRSGSRISAPSLSLPKGGGAVQGLGENFESQEFTGTANFSIPVPVPSARGLEPELSVSYSSAGGNGLFGMGFTLSTNNITRKTSSGIPRYDKSDIFIIGDEGELTPALNWDEQTKKWVPEKRLEPADVPQWEVETYRARHEGTFNLIEYWICLADGSSYWKVTTKDNQVQIYGQTKAGQITDPQDAGWTFQWLIEKTEDAHGNQILYHYDSDDEKQGVNGHDCRANRYLSKIEYGNYWAGEVNFFAFQVAFKYETRPDPSSSYRSGFEIRTLRRCHEIQIYHNFHDQFDGKPFLTRTLAFTYEQASALSPGASLGPDMSFIKEIIETGHRTESNGTITSKPLPPLTFLYSGFDPGGQSYQLMKVSGNGSIPGQLNKGEYLPIDLQGEGLSGLLYSDAETTLYWEPEGNGLYCGPKNPEHFPLNKDLGDSRLSITALAGNGVPDLLVRSSEESGFYRSVATGKWKPFRPFKSTPIDLTSKNSEMIDLNGGGLSDLLVLDNDYIKNYPSLGLEGFGAPEVVEKEPDFPTVQNVGEEEVLTFADLFGDGLSHRTRIRNGLIECWPNLGHGNFGAKVTFGNAPRFGTTLDAKRLFLADLDGSGMTDLIYASYDHIQIYFNQSGNSFSDPVTISLPAPYDELSRISFGDVNGNGTSCLILTRLSPEVTHHYYDFAGESKPYLLTEVDNRLGGITRIEYSTSVKQYLEDKKEGHTWPTRLFFPVHVIVKVEHLDQISGARFVSRHKYHDGYYDPVEREFRGFGYVEGWDTEDYESFSYSSNESDFPVQEINKELFVPPTYTRSWYHTGVFIKSGSISRHYAGKYWSGDDKAWPMHDSAFAPEIYEYGAETVRQAYAALAGHMIREEVYGLDESSLESNPYTVNENNVEVRLIQPQEGPHHASLLAYKLEETAYHYERNPADPRIQQELTLQIDQYGNVERKCSIAYPRRREATEAIYPEQELLRMVVTDESFINHEETALEPYRWIGVPFESREYEIEGQTAPSMGFTFDYIKEEIDTALKDPIPYGMPFTSGQCQARLFSWSRSYEWNEAQSEALELGSIGSRGLLHHEESAVLTAELVTTAFEGKVDDSALTGSAGYWFDQGYWWNRGLIQHYKTTNKEFFLPCQTDGSFTGVDLESHLNPTTTVTYDSYNLTETAVTHYLSGMPSVTGGEPSGGSVTIASTAEIDYNTMSPWRLTDPNGNRQEVLFDPLGMVVVTSTYGTEEGKAVGDDPVCVYTRQTGTSLEDILEHQEKYLQKATSFFFYDMTAWTTRKQPALAVSLTRQRHIHELVAGGDSQVQVAITYSDGLGRVVESKLETEPGPVALWDDSGKLLRDTNGKIRTFDASSRWIVSGRTVYNNKGKPTEQYLDYFSPTPDYEDQQKITEQGLVPPPSVIHYDPLNRIKRTDSPKGFFSKIEIGAWEARSFDTNDTVLDSTFYKNFPTDPTTQAMKNERDALDKAALFYDTPSVRVIDTLGRTGRTIKNNLGAVSPSAFDKITSGSGTTAQELWDKLVGDGYMAKDSHDPTMARVTEKLQPYDLDFQKLFKGEYMELAAPTLGILKENGLMTLNIIDINQKIVRTTDPRLLYANATEGTNYFNFTHIYDMSGNDLVTVSVDGGSSRTLDDIFGKPLEGWDSRTFQTSHRYDRLGRPLQVKVVGGDGENGISKFATPVTTEIIVYGEGQPSAADYNLIGKPYKHNDPAGLLLTPAYSLGGECMESTRKVRSDYQREANWITQAMKNIAGAEGFTSSFRYDAVGRVIEETTPDKSVTRSHYDMVGRLFRVDIVTEDEPGDAVEVIKGIEYDANGKRTQINYANAVVTDYCYEDTTERLLSIKTTSGAQSLLQDISCTYDPAGNITRKEDSSWKTVFCYEQSVKALSCYTYDALYRLLNATGRQQPVLQKGPVRNSKTDGLMPFCPPDAKDQKQLEKYTESYEYDDGGNMVERIHNAPSLSWNRKTEVEADSNRLSGYDYDESGNMKSLDHLSIIFWSYRNRIARADVTSKTAGETDCEYYLYDSGGERVLKVSERVTGTGEGATTEIVESHYFGKYELRRTKERKGQAIEATSERQSLSVMDDKTRVCLTNYWPALTSDGSEQDAPRERRFRYQLDDPLGSVALEVDAKGNRITYEEYLPYGGVAFMAADNEADAESKEFCYSSKELDDLTGLYYYGARYYPSWLGKWLNPDPGGTIDRINLFEFCDNNPITRFDSTGFDPIDERALYDAVRYMKVKEFDNTLEIANAVHLEALSNAKLFTDERARFSPMLEGRIVGIFNEFAGAFACANETLRKALASAGGRTGGAGYSQLSRYGPLRTKSNSTFESAFPAIDMSKRTGMRPFELHHLMYKALFPRLAVTTMNFAMATRGSSSSGMIGTHEGLFHLISSGNDRSIYRREIAGIAGIIKRLAASSIGIDLDKTPTPSGVASWLKLEHGSSAYSISSASATHEFRSPSARIQRVNALKREKAGKTDRRLFLKRPLSGGIKKYSGKKRLRLNLKVVSQLKKIALTGDL